MITGHNDINQKYIDLHTHSTASDGSMTPPELVRHAYRKGLSAVALTDHDTVAGAEQALEEGRRLGIEVIAGVEISVSLSIWDLPAYKCPDCGRSEDHAQKSNEPEMHLLGYFPNGGYEPILKTLEELREKREQRNPRIVSKLNEMGFDITMDEVASKAKGGIAGRPHIARVLLEKGYISSMAEGFDKYLAPGRPAYFRKDKLTPEEGIAEILRSGGIPVLAHPIYLGLEGSQLDQVMKRLKAAGLAGIEALYTDNTPEQTKELLELAARNGLIVTGGSDFHGSFKPDIEIGIGRGNLRIPYELLPGLKQYMA
jgi:hypothetical protein